MEYIEFMSWILVASIVTFGFTWLMTSEEERELMGLIARKDRDGVLKFARRFGLIDPFNTTISWRTYDKSFRIPHSMVGQLYAFLLRGGKGEIKDEWVQTVVENLQQADTYYHFRHYFINGLRSQDKELGELVEKKSKKRRV